MKTRKNKCFKKRKMHANQFIDKYFMKTTLETDLHDTITLLNVKNIGHLWARFGKSRNIYRGVLLNVNLWIFNAFPCPIVSAPRTSLTRQQYKRMRKRTQIDWSSNDCGMRRTASSNIVKADHKDFEQLHCSHHSRYKHSTLCITLMVSIGELRRAWHWRHNWYQSLRLLLAPHYRRRLSRHHSTAQAVNQCVKSY
jgi:hypothetical protein